MSEDAASERRDLLPANHLQKQDGRFKKGQSGNPAGKRPGTRSRASVLAENMLDNEVEGLVRKLIDMAHTGDSAALRICIDRLLPPRRVRPVSLELPPLRTPADGPRVIASITTAVASGEISAGEGTELVAMVNSFLEACLAGELAERVNALEQWRTEERSKES